MVQDRRVVLLLALGAALVTVNWATYIWGVNNGHVVETSLGYFINPLVTVLMGVFVLGERLRPWPWPALAIGAGAVAGSRSTTAGRPGWRWCWPSVRHYGLCKKQAGPPRGRVADPGDDADRRWP